jgi:hypothetical protein
MRIGVIIPDRGDRNEFLKNCTRMINNQTLHPVRVELVDDQPINDKCDITWRYRKGYSKFKKGDIDVIAFMENDDWYDSQYLELMVKGWEENGRPDLFGTSYTIYYNLILKKYFKFNHMQQASAMNTFIKPELVFTWPQDHDPYTDQWLWTSGNIKNRVIWEPPRVLSVGMKHGIGKTGGMFHTDKFSRFTEPDNGFLQQTLDQESFKFYSGIVLKN